MKTYTRPVSHSQGESTPIGSPAASRSVLTTGDSRMNVVTPTSTTDSVASSPQRARRLGGAGSDSGVQGRFEMSRSAGARSMNAYRTVVQRAMWTAVVTAASRLSPSTVSQGASAAARRNATTAATTGTTETSSVVSIRV